jgi:hypothetical protein
MSKYIIDIHGEIEGDYEIIGKYQGLRVGHWIDGHCSECGCDVPAYIVDWRWIKDMDAKYCPNCGAKMESEAENG